MILFSRQGDHENMAVKDLPLVLAINGRARKDALYVPLPIVRSQAPGTLYIPPVLHSLARVDFRNTML